MFNKENLFAAAVLITTGFLGAAKTHAQNTRCYTLESLQGSYGVVIHYGANVAAGIQAETLDGNGNLTRTGVNNQPIVGSPTGLRTVAPVTSVGTYTVNCDGTGTINRIVTRADGTTAAAADDFLVTEAVERNGRLTATAIFDIQKDPSVIVPGGIFLVRTHTLRSDTGPHANPPLDAQLQSLACGTNPPAPSCQATVNVWNYYLIKNVNAAATPLVIGDGTRTLTVQQYLEARATAGLVNR